MTDESTSAVNPAEDASPDAGSSALGLSGLGSGLLARQPTPAADEAVTVLKVCPQCGAEYETGSRFCLKDGTALRPKSGNDPLIGRVIADRYLILALIGEGGMGRVYLAEHVKMNRQCAVKVMNPSLVNDHESAARFAREASNAARILHPNVAAVFDFGESDKIVYLVMEYVDGESVAQILAREGRIDPRRAIDIARQVADGLAAAHELGIVHRDLKPDNIIVAQQRGGREIPKVVDFGIAKAVSDAPQDALTRSGLVIGTPEYMSPEQLLGDPVDARADIYSLGCILYQMLTGSQAFAADSREQMIRRRLHEPAPHARDLVPELPRRLDTMIARMLARSPNDRMSTAGEVREALDPAIVLGGWVGTTVAAKSSAAAPTTTMEQVSAERVLTPTVPINRQKVRGRRAGMVAATVAMLGLAGVILTKQVQRSQASEGSLLTQHSTSETPNLSDSVSTDSNAVSGAAGVAPNGVQGIGAVAPETHDSTNTAPRGPRTPAKPKAATPDAASAAEMPVADPGPSRETMAVDSAFAPLRLAINSGTMESLDLAVPSLDKQIRDVFARVFQNGQRIRVEIRRDSLPPMTGDRADVRVMLNVHYDDRKSGAPFDLSVPAVAELRRSGENWRLAKLVTAP